MSNASSLYAPFFYNETQGEKRIRFFFYGGVIPFFICLATASNVLTITSLTRLLRRNKQHSTMYHNLRLLSMSDQAAMLFVTPLALWFVDLRLCSQAYAFYLAHVGFPLSNAFIGTSVWISVSTIRSQFKAVQKPFEAVETQVTNLYKSAGAALGLNLLLFAPMTFKNRLCHPPSAISPCPRGTSVCRADASDWADMEVAYNWVRETFTRLFPLVAVVYYNLAIVALYRRHKITRLKSINKYQRSRARVTGQTQQKRLFRVVTIISLLFLVSTVPGAVLNLTFESSLRVHLAYQVFRAVANSLDVAKFAANFFLYAAVDRNIHNGLRCRVR